MAELDSRAVVWMIASPESFVTCLSSCERMPLLKRTRRASARDIGAQLAKILAAKAPFGRLGGGPGVKVRGSGSSRGSRLMSFSASPGEDDRGRDISHARSTPAQRGGRPLPREHRASRSNGHHERGVRLPVLSTRPGLAGGSAESTVARNRAHVLISPGPASRTAGLAVCALLPWRGSS